MNIFYVNKKSLLASLMAGLLCCGAAGAAQARQDAPKGLVIDSAGLIFAQENKEGYRALTAIEPAAGTPQPLSGAVVKRNTDTRAGVELSYSSNEGPATQTVERTIIVHTTIPLPPG